MKFSLRDFVLFVGAWIALCAFLNKPSTGENPPARVEHVYVGPQVVYGASAFDSEASVAYKPASNAGQEVVPLCSDLLLMYQERSLSMNKCDDALEKTETVLSQCAHELIVARDDCNQCKKESVSLNIIEDLLAENESLEAKLAELAPEIIKLATKATVQHFHIGIIGVLSFVVLVLYLIELRNWQSRFNCLTNETNNKYNNIVFWVKEASHWRYQWFLQRLSRKDWEAEAQYWKEEAKNLSAELKKIPRHSMCRRSQTRGAR